MRQKSTLPMLPLYWSESADERAALAQLGRVGDLMSNLFKRRQCQTRASKT
jgi:hypothetical protein